VAERHKDPAGAIHGAQYREGHARSRTGPAEALAGVGRPDPHEVFQSTSRPISSGVREFPIFQFLPNALSLGYSVIPSRSSSDFLPQA